MTVYPPDERLAAFIECYWTVPRNISVILQQQEIAVPGTSIELVFNPETTQKVFLIRSSIFFGRQNGTNFQYDTDPNPIFGITFKINGLSPFSKLPLNEADILPMTKPLLPSCRIKPADVLGKSLYDFIDNLSEAKSIVEKIGVANAFFTLLLPGMRPIDYFMNNVISEMFNNKGRMSINLLAKKFNIHKKTIERRFANATGLNPKTFSRIIRINHILKNCWGPREAGLSDLFDELGYHDSSHFHKDFKEFTKITPSKFLSQEYRILRGPNR